MKYHLRLGLILAILFCAGGGGLYLYAKRLLARADPDRARLDERPIPVRTELVSESTIQQVIGGTATTEAYRSWAAQIASDDILRSVALVIKGVGFAEGEFVKAGDVLFEIDDRPVRELATKRENALAAARLTLARTLLESEMNRRDRERELQSAMDEQKYREKDYLVKSIILRMFFTLFSKNLAALIEKSEAESNHAQAVYARAEVGRRVIKAKDQVRLGKVRDEEAETLARYQVEAAQVDLDAALRALGRCRVTSPLDGYLDVVTIVPGSGILPDNPITTVRKIDPIHVRMDLPQERIDDVRVGQEVEVIFDHIPAERFGGRVVRVSSAVNTPLRVLPVVIQVANPTHRIKAGITAYARLTVEKRAVSVPSLGILRRANKAVAYRIEDGRVRSREVRVGHSLGRGLVEVREGLSSGDEVVVFHNFYRQTANLLGSESYLKEGDPVDPRWREAWVGHE